jgi:hypothetical protein
MPPARDAAQTDVGAKAVNQPLLAAAWMGTTQPHDIAKAKRDDG